MVFRHNVSTRVFRKAAIICDQVVADLDALLANKHVRRPCDQFFHVVLRLVAERAA
jgi:hypothetical protein